MRDLMYSKQGNRLTCAYGRDGRRAVAKISWFDRGLELVAPLVALVAAAFRAPVS